jgi:hypothetical protein
MIAAVAFRISTWQANIFRQWLIGRAARQHIQSRLPITVFVTAREKVLVN